MDRVVSGELYGFAGMVAGLIRGNIEAHPSRAALIDKARGTVVLRAIDVDAIATLTFGEGRIRIGDAPLERPSVEIIANADQMLAFTTAPLRFGLPDAMKPEGRALTKEIMTGHIKVRGMATHLGLIRRLNGLLSVQ